MDKKRRASIKRYISMALIAALVALLAALPAMVGSGDSEENKASILTDTVRQGSIETAIFSGAPLESQEVTEVSIPYGVKVIALLKANGDTVASGDAIAQVDKVSVMTAIHGVQESLDAITSDLYTASQKITPGVLTVGEDGALYSNGKAIEEEKLSSYADYLRLSAQHREYEEILLDLFRMYRLGTVHASADGMIDGLDKSIVQKLAFEGEVTLSLLSDTQAPEEPAASGYDCYACTVVAAGATQLVVMRSETVTHVEDLADLSGVDTTNLTVYDILPLSIPVYSQDWEASQAAVGDVLIIAADGSGVTMAIKAASGGEEMPDMEEEGELSADDLEDLMSAAGAAVGGGRGGFGGGGSGKESTLYSTAKTRLCSLVPQETMLLHIPVDELDIAHVETGMTARVTLDAIPDQTFQGTVTEVSKFGTNNGGSSKFTVTVELPWREGMLPGMNAAVSLPRETLEDILLVPVAALAELDGKTVIYTGYDEKTEQLTAPVSVELGISDGEHVQILSGLEAGAAIRYSYYDVLEISNAVASRSMFR